LYNKSNAKVPSENIFHFNSVYFLTLVDILPLICNIFWFHWGLYPSLRGLRKK